MKFKVLLVVFLVLISCKTKNKKTETASNSSGPEVKEASAKTNDLEIYDFEGLEPFLNKKDGKVHVINFWATWCAPCVKELPYFERLATAYGSKGVEVLLVSLDFPHQYDTKLKPFIKEHKIRSKVIVLDDVDMNSWIPKVDASWSGAIPATIIYTNDERKFFEQSFSYKELENQVKPFLN